MMGVLRGGAEASLSSVQGNASSLRLLSALRNLVALSLFLVPTAGRCNGREAHPEEPGRRKLPGCDMQKRARGGKLRVPWRDMSSAAGESYSSPEGKKATRYDSSRARPESPVTRHRPGSTLPKLLVPSFLLPALLSSPSALAPRRPSAPALLSARESFQLLCVRPLPNLPALASTPIGLSSQRALAPIPNAAWYR